jgi:hypothetical protein
VRKQAMSLDEAGGGLGLPETAGIREVRAIYKRLLFEWHPDHCADAPEACREMSRKIVEAYRVVDAYCQQYPIPFDPEAVINKTNDAEEFMKRRFGNDPILQ